MRKQKVAAEFWYVCWRKDLGFLSWTSRRAAKDSKKELSRTWERPWIEIRKHGMRCLKIKASAVRP